MRKLNLIQRNHRYNSQNFCNPTPLYLTADGKTTSSVEDALLDAYNSPEVAGYDYDVTTPHQIYNLPRPYSFNPLDPSARSLAFEARANFEGLTSIPGDYTDKFEAISYANNVSNILFPKVRALKSNSKNDK